MNFYAVDLHIHTVLSPCASERMVPSAIVREALERNLAMIAICDHNAAGNIDAVREAAGNELIVLGGIEVTTIEEVHVLGLFRDSSVPKELAAEIRRALPDELPSHRVYREQLMVDARDVVVGKETKMLSASSHLSLSEVVDSIKTRGGIAVASHIDRPSFSVLSQLGMIPDDVVFDAVEISAAGVAANMMERFRSTGLPMITSSDSHDPSEVGTCVFFLESREPDFDELVLALKGAQGRRCFIA